ncbi:MAG: hypothetical protein N3G77_01555 [Nitrososphaeria archaeon]|nr:hypothetical protein [Nitrososphaeria archaeon]
MIESIKRVYMLDVKEELLEKTYERILEFIENSKILEFEVEELEDVVEEF